MTRFRFPVPSTATRRFTALLLLLLALRALVPAGFMATATAHGVEMVFCEPGAGASAHHAHHHSHGSAADPNCPFAQSAGPAPLPALPALAAAPPEVNFVHRILPQRTAVASGPPRQQAPRGPPVLA